MNQKGFTHLLLILLVTALIPVAVLAFVYFGTPKETVIPPASPLPTEITEPEQSWNTYENNLANFKLEYPAEYTLNSDSDIYFSITSPEDLTRRVNALTSEDLKVVVSVHEVEEGFDLVSVKDTYVNGENSNEHWITIDSIETYVFDNNFLGDGRVYNLIHNGYRISIDKLPAETDRNETFEKILESFEFN